MQAQQQNDANTRRYRRILVVILVLYLAMWSSIAAVLYLAADNANKQSIRESEREVAGYLEHYRAELESQVKIFAYWEDGIDNLAVASVDRAWADREMGQYLIDDLGIDLWFVLDPAARAASAKLGQAYVDADMLGISERERRQIQLAARREVGPPPEPISAYIMAHNGHNLVSSSALIIESRLVPRERSWVLTFGRPLTDIFRDIAANHDVDLTLADGPGLSAQDHLKLPLHGLDGEPLTWVQWRIALAGKRFIAFIVPWVACLFILTMLLCAFLLTRVADMYRKLCVSENRFRDAIDALSDGFVIYDSEDRLAVCNARYREFYARSAQAISIGNTFEQVLRHGFAQGQYGVSTLDGETEDIERRINRRLSAHRRPGGAFEQQLGDGRWIRVVERRMSDGGIVSFRSDISELKQREQELLEAKRVAESASEAKSRFLASVSHEIRTPLNAMLGFLELLGEAPLPECSKAHVNIARRSGEHLLTIIDNLLDFSKIEAGNFDLSIAPFHLGHVIDSVVGMLRPLAEQRDLVLDAKVNVACPEILGDEARLRQVLLNLVANGLKFTETGGVVLSVCDVADEDGRCCLEFTVEDSGVGIEADKINTIFEPFFQVGNEQGSSQSGVGLGLPISRKLVTLMSGELSVSSSPGCGSCFRFILTFAPAPAPVASAHSAQRPAEADQSAVLPNDVTVLVADDVEPNRLLLAAMLRGSNYRACFASNGLEAVAAMSEQRPDVVLMDILMPEMDGLQATSVIRSDMGEGNVPIIALTASAMKGDRDRFMAAGMNDYLAKPFTKKALFAVLARWAPARDNSYASDTDTSGAVASTSASASDTDSTRGR